jgi:hypothetical protein
MADVVNFHCAAVAAVLTTISIGCLWPHTTSAQSVLHEAADETSIRHTVEKIEDEDTDGVQKNDLHELDRLWSDELTVNNPNNQIVGKQAVFGFMRRRSGLQYDSYERHREAIVVERLFSMPTLSAAV